MKAEELRLGNLVIQNGFETKVHHIEWRYKDVYQVNDLAIHEQDLKPIPLDAQWLERMGFEKYLNQSSRYKYREGYYKFGPAYMLDMGGYYSISTMTYAHEEEVDLVEIKYVHQLQNLYYALTGTELKIEL